jgi:hypothetical protein
MDYGIKVSEDGFDVKTADDKNLSLKTGFSLLNVCQEGSLTVNETPEVISHNLGYQPQFLVWVDEGSGIKIDGTGLATGMDTFGTAFINTSDLNIYAEDGDGVRYYIFYEPLTTGSSPVIPSTNNIGIKISKDGYDVKTANILQQTFNSEKNSIKIALSDISSHTVNTTYNFLVSHGLNTTPGYLIFFEVDGSGKWWSENEIDTLSGKNVKLNSWTTSSQLVASVTSTASCTVKIKYYVLADPAI